MSIDASFKLDQPDEAACSMTIVMSLAEWKLVREQVAGTSYPSWKLREIISALVDRAERHFHATGKPE